MAFYKKLGYFAAPSLLVALSATTITGCDNATKLAEDLCGPCGDIELGDVSISGSAQLDGFFAAVSTLNSATVTASADFEGGLANLEAAFGLEGSGNLSARVDNLIAAVKLDFGASADAKLVMDITPAKCSASLNVAVEAQANCEAKAECDVQASPGEVSVSCEGSCTGGCEGGCSAEAEAKCELSPGSVACEGTCEGTCELEAGATCEGTCKGECAGNCSVVNTDGTCAGECDAACEGSCELKAGASCEGTCHGKCTVDPPSGGCEGSATAKCEGKCEGSCSGGCEGSATPPSASANCEATADCQASASAQASASMECTPPSVEISLQFSGTVDASAQAELSAKVLALKVNGVVMLQSFVKYKALIDGEVNGEVAFETPPVEAVIDSLNAVFQAGVEGNLIKDLPAGRLPCAFPAVEASVSMLGDIVADAGVTLAAQGKFVASFTTGFQ